MQTIYFRNYRPAVLLGRLPRRGPQQQKGIDVKSLFGGVVLGAMLAAGAIVLQDVPPFVTASGYPAKPAGTNNEGLRRRGFSAADIAAVRRAYKTLYREGLPLEQARTALAQAAQDAPLLEPLVSFLATSSRGIVR